MAAVWMGENQRAYKALADADMFASAKRTIGKVDATNIRQSLLVYVTDTRNTRRHLGLRVRQARANYGGMA